MVGSRSDRCWKNRIQTKCCGRLVEGTITSLKGASEWFSKDDILAQPEVEGIKVEKRKRALQVELTIWERHRSRKSVRSVWWASSIPFCLKLKVCVETWWEVEPVGWTVASSQTVSRTEPKDLDLTQQSLGAAQGVMRSELSSQKLNLKTIWRVS